MDFPVSISTKYLPHPSKKVKIYYPLVTNSQDFKVQSKINYAIINTLNKLLIESSFYRPELVELIATFEIKNNQRGILSLNLIVYSFTGGAHGITVVKSLTFDTKTGKRYDLKELFKPGSDYQKKISDQIRVKIKEWDISLLEPFKGIQGNQDFYIADTSIVVYFQLYEISPYAQGFPYFPIPILDLKDSIKDNGPLDRMMTFIGI
jgi:hypothetical protein